MVERDANGMIKVYTFCMKYFFKGGVEATEFKKYGKTNACFTDYSMGVEWARRQKREWEWLFSDGCAVWNYFIDWMKDDNFFQD